MKTLIVFILSFFLLPQLDSEKMIWNENQKLSWENFQGKPMPKAGFVASTTTGLHFSYSYSMDENVAIVKYTVESFFDPKTSWFIPEKVSQKVLNHEQLHFDISELHARILRNKLNSMKFSTNAKTEIETVYLQIEEERRKMQKQFDAETDHSQNIEKEIFWETKIAKQLKQYASWK